MIRKVAFCPGEYYHIVNRGVSQSNIFVNETDWIRFLFLILYFQAPVTIYNISDFVARFTKHRMFSSSRESAITVQDIVKERRVELLCFALMPSHFHLLVREKDEHGISRYLQRMQNAYSKYFNTKYHRTGHIFQGPFRAVHIEDNEQLLYTSAYIHSNPRELSGWRKNFESYPWSSLGDYAHTNRWGDLLVRQYLLEQYPHRAEYIRAVRQSGAKLNDEERAQMESF